MFLLGIDILSTELAGVHKGVLGLENIVYQVYAPYPNFLSEQTLEKWKAQHVREHFGLMILETYMRLDKMLKGQNRGVSGFTSGVVIPHNNQVLLSSILGKPNLVARP